jgi:hypothetical protein
MLSNLQRFPCEPDYQECMRLASRYHFPSSRHGHRNPSANITPDVPSKANTQFFVQTVNAAATVPLYDSIGSLCFFSLMQLMNVPSTAEATAHTTRKRGDIYRPARWSPPPDVIAWFLPASAP